MRPVFRSELVGLMMTLLCELCNYAVKATGFCCIELNCCLLCKAHTERFPHTLCVLSGGILAGLISDRLEKRASTCGMMLLLAAPTVRACPSLTALPEAVTPCPGHFCRQHLPAWM